ncbi:helix-hairpin-helix domain-containing protein, partial [Micromonospora carbonacea]|uniref:helix-hairpin-helix domain-containing protein n=1 Tax=Micromonospora carbonacea TaxID=47853 RepID=UPI00332504AC
MTQQGVPDGLLAADLDILMPQRAVAVLGRAGVNTTQDLLRLSERVLRALPGVGKETAKLILAALEDAGAQLAPDAWGAYTCARDDTPAGDVNL